MKNIQFQVPVYSQMRFFVWITLCMGMVIPSFAQTGEEATKDETQKDTTVANDTEKSEKALLRMSFEAFTINDSVKLVARVRSKVGAKFQNTAGVEVSFYKNETGPDNLIGKGVSNRKGESYWMLPAVEIPVGSAPAMYWASVQDNPDYEDVQETVSVIRSKMRMELAEEDSIWWVKIFVGLPDASDQVSPMPEVECKIYIQRLFGLLQVGDVQTTDEEGNIKMEFPKDIKGDLSGNIIVVAKISGHEVLGNVEVRNTINWGIPTKVDDFYLQKELWSARANSPLLLIIIVNTVLIGIWGVICFIVLEIFKINKLGKAN